MFKANQADSAEQRYKYMVAAVSEILAEEKDLIANLANISAFINVYMDKLNWVGFYILKHDELVLGPFQGLPACIRIKVGKGVCGTAAHRQETIVVENVHEFEGHIACDSNSNSEIVFPIIAKNEVFGVLDADSPEFSRFTELEEKYLGEVVKCLQKYLNEV